MMRGEKQLLRWPDGRRSLRVVESESTILPQADETASPHKSYKHNSLSSKHILLQQENFDLAQRQ